jgi:hypothetical protein
MESRLIEYLERFTLGKLYATPGTVKLFKFLRQSRGVSFSIRKGVQAGVTWL